MSGLALSISAGTAPNGTQLPSSAQALLDFCAAYLGIAGGTAFNGVNFGPNTPAPENRSLPWFKTDAAGNPVGFFSWNGSAWVTIPTVVANGNTAGRPASPSNGTVYYDTQIGAQIMWNAAANNWTTLGGTIGDVKEVTATTIDAALLANPGWAQHAASNGCVIGGASSDANGPAVAHPQGQLIGEESHTVQVSELPSHSHPESWATYTGQHQNGTQPSGVFPAVTPGSLGLPLLSTGAAGGGNAMNVIQPTMYLFRLYKKF